ncbi:MAG: hypothetical protein U0Q16_19585 [Bryobacteraceae bacterium]
MANEIDLATLLSKPASELFPGALSPEGCRAGLLLRHGRWTEAHETAQELQTREGSFWHGILHRHEPDPGNASYWFRRVGDHPLFPVLRDRAMALAEGSSLRIGKAWDPFAWIDFWEAARQRPGSTDERAAQEIDRAEWELLFDYCAAPRPR